MNAVLHLDAHSTTPYFFPRLFLLLEMEKNNDTAHTQLSLNMIYFTYMVYVDVPNYIQGHIDNTTHGTSYYSFVDGLKTLVSITEHKITWSYEDWRYSFCWMTLYFSVACWASIGVVNAPRMDMGLVRQKKLAGF